MTTSRIGRGAVVTLGAVASLAWAASAANACDTPQPPTPKTHDHHGHGHTPPPSTPKPQTAPDCTPGDSVQWAPVDKSGSPIGQFQDGNQFVRTNDEPVYGYKVELTQDAVNADCSIPVSLASYNDNGATWESSGGAQQFVGYATTTLTPTATSDVLTVKLPGVPGGTCFGQIDLYFGSTIYDGGTGPGHGALPDHDHGVTLPTGLLTAWNGSDAGGCAVTPPTPPTTQPTTPSKPSTPRTQPTTHPSTPVSSKPAAPKPTTPAPPTTTTSSPSTPTLAETGAAGVGEVSLVALAFFGAGGTAMVASRKAKGKTAGARKF